MPSRNVGVFIDSVIQYQNINSAYRKRKLDYRKYLKKCEEYGDISRAVVYGAQMNSEANNFITCLKSFGYEPNYVQVDQLTNIDRTGDIIKDIGRLLDRLDIVIIGSSSDAFTPIIELLKARGIKVIVFSCLIPYYLKWIADSWIEIVEEYLENRDDTPKTT